MKSFDLNIEKILENWEIHHAIREIIANALDERTLTSTRDIQIFPDKQGYWHIRDFGRGLQYSHLTQNENDEKLQHPNLIGRFGVGLKDALATLERHKIKVFIRSGYGVITLRRLTKHNFSDITTLHAEIRESPDPLFIGTEFVLVGCSADDVAKAKALFLRFSGNRVLEHTRFGDVIEKDVTENSSIYVNGLKVAEEPNFLFSYNVTSLTQPLRKALNRERANVGRSAYGDRIKAILLDSRSEEVIRALMSDLRNFEQGVCHDELNWLDVGVHAAKLTNASSRVVFVTPKQITTYSDAAYLANRARMDSNEIVTIPESVYGKISGQQDVAGNKIRDLREFSREENSRIELKFLDENELTPSERAIFQKTPLLLSMIGGEPTVRDVRISETLYMSESRYFEVRGMWFPDTQTIVIKRTQLSSITSYAATLLHEAAHARSMAGDMSLPFEEVLTSFLGLLAAHSLARN